MPLTSTEIVLLGVYYTLLFVLAVYGIHRYALVRLRRKCIGSEPASPSAPSEWPSITVQLPLYNEPNVAERLIDAAASFDYPGPLDIQVLDDSTDCTKDLVAHAVRRHRRNGVDIEHCRRASRDGFKAGALAAGLRRTDSELVAIFDADFVPPPDLLRRMVPFFRQDRTGMVQARWGHINREASTLTRAQAVYLDAHFAVESASRFLAGRFFNFNGTAGIWRRKAIEDAGGWSAETLTEDLDLSYRAQMAGGRFVYVGDIVVPAELPETLAGFHSQQRRWAKGSIQTARRMLPTVLSSNQSLHVRMEAFFHLTGNVAYLLTLALATLLVPSMAIRHLSGLDWTLLIDAALFAASTGSVIAFYREGQRRVGRSLTTIELVAVLPVGIGLSVVNSAAVLEGLFQQGGYFSRTPKCGSREAKVSLDRFRRIALSETVLSSFLAGSAWLFAVNGHYLAIPFIILFLGGYLHVAAYRVLETWRS
jgi:cellulose synthase/poly-beta-1,6-N-acetylglucosamine synthase-like glycosyltransferase